MSLYRAPPGTLQLNKGDQIVGHARYIDSRTFLMPLEYDDCISCNLILYGHAEQDLNPELAFPNLEPSVLPGPCMQVRLHQYQADISMHAWIGMVQPALVLRELQQDPPRDPPPPASALTVRTPVGRQSISPAPSTPNQSEIDRINYSRLLINEVEDELSDLRLCEANAESDDRQRALRFRIELLERHLALSKMVYGRVRTRLGLSDASSSSQVSTEQNPYELSFESFSIASAAQQHARRPVRGPSNSSTTTPTMRQTASRPVPPYLAFRSRRANSMPSGTSAGEISTMPFSNSPSTTPTTQQSSPRPTLRAPASSAASDTSPAQQPFSRPFLLSSLLAPPSTDTSATSAIQHAASRPTPQAPAFNSASDAPSTQRPPPRPILQSPAHHPIQRIHNLSSRTTASVGSSDSASTNPTAQASALDELLTRLSSFRESFASAKSSTVHKTRVKTPAVRCMRTHVRRLSLDDECAICYAPTPVDCKPSEVVWCRAGCGRSVHTSCFEIWRAQRTSEKSPLTCMICRVDWDEKCQCAGCHIKHVPRKTNRNKCGICVKHLFSGDEDRTVQALRLVWCKGGCGKNVHGECFENWRARRVAWGKAVLCGYCHADWAEGCAC
jgi:hypothetical protein